MVTDSRFGRSEDIRFATPAFKYPIICRFAFRIGAIASAQMKNGC